MKNISINIMKSFSLKLLFWFFFPIPKFYFGQPFDHLRLSNNDIEKFSLQPYHHISISFKGPWSRKREVWYSSILSYIDNMESTVAVHLRKKLEDCSFLKFTQYLQTECFISHVTTSNMNIYLNLTGMWWLTWLTCRLTWCDTST